MLAHLRTSPLFYMMLECSMCLLTYILGWKGKRLNKDLSSYLHCQKTVLNTCFILLEEADGRGTLQTNAKSHIHRHKKTKKSIFFFFKFHLTQVRSKRASYLLRVKGKWSSPQPCLMSDVVPFWLLGFLVDLSASYRDFYGGKIARAIKKIDTP